MFSEDQLIIFQITCHQIWNFVCFRVPAQLDFFSLSNNLGNSKNILTPSFSHFVLLYLTRILRRREKKKSIFCCVFSECGRCSQSSDGQHATQWRHARRTHAPWLLSSKNLSWGLKPFTRCSNVAVHLTHTPNTPFPLTQPTLSPSFCLLLLFSLFSHPNPCPDVFPSLSCICPICSSVVELLTPGLLAELYLSVEFASIQFPFSEWTCRYMFGRST